MRSRAQHHAVAQAAAPPAAAARSRHTTGTTRTSAASCSSSTSRCGGSISRTRSTSWLQAYGTRIPAHHGFAQCRRRSVAAGTAVRAAFRLSAHQPAGLARWVAADDRRSRLVFIVRDLAQAQEIDPRLDRGRAPAA